MVATAKQQVKNVISESPAEDTPSASGSRAGIRQSPRKLKPVVRNSESSSEKPAKRRRISSQEQEDV